MRKSSKNKKTWQGDGSRFLAVPHQVLQSEAYLSLSHPAKVLLIEIAMQFAGNNNGQLRAGRKFLASRGWSSNDTITNARNQLMDRDLIFQTVIGHRPNKASWFAVTWYPIDPHTKYDSGAQRGFERSAYKKYQNKNGCCVPQYGHLKHPTTPSDGHREKSLVPPDGSVPTNLTDYLVPSNGHHLVNHTLTESISDKSLEEELNDQNQTTHTNQKAVIGHNRQQSTAS